jgi:RNA polymerase sigma factor for flagellar operon FliA
MTNLPLIERRIAFASRRYRLDDDDAEEFASIVKLRLVEDDYAVLRAYECRSGFGTFISIVVQRMALDFRNHMWGKWHVSAEAKRLGPLAIDLDRLLHRDGRTLDEALVMLTPTHEGLTRQSLQAVAERLPERAPRRRRVGLAAADSVSVTRGEEVEEPLMASERRDASRRLSMLMTSILESMPEDDRLILQLHFEGGMAVSQIARALQLDQRLLYRRLGNLMRDLRKHIEGLGVAARDVLDLIGRDEPFLDFNMERAMDTAIRL